MYSVVEDSIDDGHLCAVEIFSPQFFFWKAGERVFNIAGDCGINRTGVAPKIRKNSVIKPVAPVANPPNESGELSHLIYSCNITRWPWGKGRAKPIRVCGLDAPVAPWSSSTWLPISNSLNRWTSSYDEWPINLKSRCAECRNNLISIHI